MIPHVWLCVVMDRAMSRQDPFKLVLPELLHRLDLVRPRIPGDAAKGRQGFASGRPRQMIAGKQKLVFVQIDHVTARVAGRGNHEQIFINFDGCLAGNNSLNAQSRGAIVSVHHALTAKLLAKQFMIGDVVAMG